MGENRQSKRQKGARGEGGLSPSLFFGDFFFFCLVFLNFLSGCSLLAWPMSQVPTRLSAYSDNAFMSLIFNYSFFFFSELIMLAL